MTRRAAWPVGPGADSPSPVPAATATLTVLLPCHNEASAIASVIADYRAVFPEARILVIDNASDDATAVIAASLGVEVITEPRKGKARGVLTALPHVDSDLLLMADGDATYPAAGGRLLVEEWGRTGADMITGLRQAQDGNAAFRPLHQRGSRVFESIVRALFGAQTHDVFSGLRLFTRRFYCHVPILHDGFELEMELTAQAIDKGFRVAEVPVPFGARWDGTVSKLSTVRDGVRILRALFVLHRDHKPMRYFGVLATGAFVAGLVAGWFPVVEFIRTGQVLRLPLAVLAASFEIIAVVTFYSGVILESGLRANREAFQITLRASDAAHHRHVAAADRPIQPPAVGDPRPPGAAGA